MSRQIHVGGPLYANQLRLTAGRNTFSYADGTATPLAAIAGAPIAAIDGSALGALSAGRITIRSTEKGSGVNMQGGMAANASGLTISADGKITMGRVHGETGVSVKSTKAVIAADKITSKKSVSVAAQQGITLTTVAADQSVDLNSGAGLLSASGNIDSNGFVKLQSQGAVAISEASAGTDLSITATGAVSTSDTITASGTLSIIGGTVSTAKQVTGGMALNLESTSGNLSATAVLISRAGVSLKSSGKIALNDSVLGQGSVAIAAQGNVSGKSISSGIDLAATATAGALVSGSTPADLTITSAAGNISADTLLSTGNTALTSLGNTSQTGKAQSGGSISIVAGSADLAALTSGIDLAQSNTAGHLVAAATPSDISVTTNSGNLNAQSLTSTGRTALNSAGNAAVTGNSLSAGNTSISGNNVQTALVAAGVDIPASFTSASGSVIIGTSASDVTFKANSGTINSGLTMATGNINASAAGAATFSGSVLANGPVGISANGINAQSVASGVNFANLGGGLNLVATCIANPRTLTLQAGTGAIQAHDLASAGNMSLTSNGAIGYHSLESFADASLNSTAGAASIGSQTWTKGNLTITAVSADLSILGDTLTSSAGDISVKSKSLGTDVSTLVASGHDLIISLSANSTNSGQLAAANDITLNSSSSFTNASTGLIDSGRDAGLHIASTLTNQTGAIVATRNLYLDGGTGNAKSVAIVNHAGLLQSGQDMRIDTQTLTNEADGIPTVLRNQQIANGVVSGFAVNPNILNKPVQILTMKNDAAGPGYFYAATPNGNWADYGSQMYGVSQTLSDGIVYRSNNFHQVTTIDVNGYDVNRKWSFLNSGYLQTDASGLLAPSVTSLPYYIQLTNSEYWKTGVGFLGLGSEPHDVGRVFAFNNNANITETSTKDILLNTPAPGAIEAGNNLIINADTLNNTYSSIEATGYASLTGTTLNNTGLALNQSTARTCNADDTCYAYDANGNHIASADVAKGGTTTSGTTYATVGGTIISKGNMNVAFATVYNTGGSAPTGNVAVSTLSNRTANFGKGAGGFNGLSGITGGNALFKFSGTSATAAAPQLGTPNSGGVGGTVPNQIFIFETRSAFLDVSKFYGSAYFLAQIGYRPDQQITFLGDAYYENMLIDAELRQQTGAGLGTFLPGEDAIAEMKLLLNNGVDFLKAHNMHLGDKLDAKLIANLTVSIVVYQTQVVNGVTALVPVVYVANADLARLGATGGLIQAANLNLNAGQLDNGGTIQANKNLDINVNNATINGGTLAAGNNLKLTSTGNIWFKAASTTFGGDTVLLLRVGVKAGGDATIAAGGNLSAQGTKFQAGGNVGMGAAAIDLGSGKADPNNKNYAANQFSSIDAGKDITLQATTSLTLTAVDANAGGNIGLAAKDITVGADQVARNLTTANGSAGTGTTVTSAESTSRGSNLSAGGTLAMNADSNIVVQGSNATSGGAMSLNAGNNLMVSADNNTANSTTSGPGFSSTDNESTNAGSTLKSGGNLALNATKNVVVQGSSAQAGGDLNVKAGQAVLIIQGQNTDKSTSNSSHCGGGLFGGCSSNSSASDTTTNAGSSLSANGNVAIASGRDTLVSASKVEAGTNGGAGDLSA